MTLRHHCREPRYISADTRSWSQYRTSRQNDALTPGQDAHSGTDAIVVLDTQNAGYVRNVDGAPVGGQDQ